MSNKILEMKKIQKFEEKNFVNLKKNHLKKISKLIKLPGK